MIIYGTFAAAMPHLSIDPVVAGSAIVNSLQHLVSRVTNPVQGAVISVTRFNTGSSVQTLRQLAYMLHVLSIKLQVKGFM